jgi:hypothetical protein
MARNDPGFRSSHGNCHFQRFDGARQRAAVVGIDDWIARRSEDVAEMQHVRLRKIDERITVCVRWRREKGSHLLTIEMKADPVGVGDDRTRPLGWLRHELSATPRKAELFERAEPDVIVGEDQDAPIGERLVAADMVWVDVRVDQEPNVAIGNLPHRSDQPIGQRREQ